MCVCEYKAVQVALQKVQVLACSTVRPASGPNRPSFDACCLAQGPHGSSTLYFVRRGKVGRWLLRALNRVDRRQGRGAEPDPHPFSISINE